MNRNIPILFMSAKDDLPSKQKGFQTGIDDYMVKPIEPDENLNAGYHQNPYYKHVGRQEEGTVLLRFKRDRKLVNKMELTRLQRNFEDCMHQIDVLEKSKTGKGILPYFCYRAIVSKRIETVNPLMEKKYDEVYEICEKGSRLLG